MTAMFDAQPRRHPVQTFQFWFAIVLCAGIVLAWRFEMVPFSRSETAFDPIPEFIEDEPMPPPPEGGDNEIELADWPDDEPDLLSGLPGPPDSPGQPMAPPQGEPSVPEQDAPAPWARQSVQTAAATTDPDRERQPVAAASASTLSNDRDEDVARKDFPGETPARETDRASSERPDSDAASAGRHAGPTDSGIHLDEVNRLIADGEDVAAHRRLSTWYWQHPEQRERFQDRLDLLARRIYFQPKPHYIAPYRVQSGDRMETIAREYRQSWEYLAKLNRVDPERIQAGQELKVLQGPFSVVVDLSRFELTVHAHGYYVTRFPVGIGKEGATPVGTFRVTDKVTDPTYYGEEGVIAHDDPANPWGNGGLPSTTKRGPSRGTGFMARSSHPRSGKRSRGAASGSATGTSPTCTICSPSVPK
jgi:LysM repeat protein